MWAYRSVWLANRRTDAWRSWTFGDAAHCLGRHRCRWHRHGHHQSHNHIPFLLLCRPAIIEIGRRPGGSQRSCCCGQRREQRQRQRRSPFDRSQRQYGENVSGVFATGEPDVFVCPLPGAFSQSRWADLQVVPGQPRQSVLVQFRVSLFYNT